MTRPHLRISKTRLAADPWGEGTTARPPEKSAAGEALDRAKQCVGLMAALGRFDLIDDLVVEIQRRQQRREGFEI